jgi:SSS family solute:Na+ symporter
MRINEALGTLDIGIILGYLLLMLFIGVYVGRKHEDSTDYFLAGRSMIWPFIGLSLFASNISSTTLVGLAGDAYATGISVFNYEWMAAVVLVFFVIFVLPQVLQSKVFTMPEFLERRYDRRARVYFSGLTIFLNIFVDTAGSLFSGALIIGMVFPDLSVVTIVSILAVIAGGYTVIGGLAAVIFTDAIQAILLMVGSLFITVIAFEQVGSWNAVVEAVDPAKLSLIRPLADPGVPWLGLVVGIPLLGFYFWCTNQFMVQRVLSAKDLHHGRWGCLFAGLLKLGVIFCMVLPGTIAILLYPNLERADLVYPTLMFDLLPTGILGLSVAAFIAALMSQIDSTLNSASTLVTMDFVQAHRPDLSPHALMTVGRAVTFLFMLVAVLWAPQIENFQSLFKYLQSTLAYAVPPVVCLFLVGIFSSRATASSAWAVIVGGVIGGIALFVLNEVVGVLDLHFLYIAPILLIWCLLIQTVAMMREGVPPRADQKALVWSRGSFQTETTSLRALPWYQNYRVLSGALLLVTAALVWNFR